MSRTELHQLWHSLDIDGLGAVDFAEFSATLFPQSRKTLEANLARAEDDGSFAKDGRPEDGAGADAGAPKESFGEKRGSISDDVDEVLSRFSRSYKLGQQQKRDKDEAAPDHGMPSESSATGGPALEAMHVQLVELHTALGGMDERMRRVEAVCTGMHELLQGLQSTQGTAKARLRAKASSRASGLGEGLGDVKSHTDLPGAVGVGASSPPPADVLARRADIDFVQDAQASMHSSCKDAPGRVVSNPLMGAVVDSAHDRVDQAEKRAEAVPVPVAESGVAAQLVQPTPQRPVAPAPASAKTDDSTRALPPGWFEAAAPDGSIYFYHATSGATQSVRPTLAGDSTQLSA